MVTKNANGAENTNSNEKCRIVWNDPDTGVTVDFSKIIGFNEFPKGIVVFGGHFGDCGKGKIVDIYAEKYSNEGFKILSVSGNGGGNSGHTVVVDGRKYDFHYLTSAGLSADIILLGAGKTIDPIKLQEEMEQLPEEKRKIVCVSSRATMVSIAEKVMDKWCENMRTNSGNKVIGTTGSGNGPAIGNRGYRVHLTFADVLGEKGYEKTFEDFKQMIRNNPLYPDVVKDSLTDEYLEELWESIHSLNIVDCEQLIKKCRIDGNYAVILEVSQAVCLDPLFGNGGHYTTSTQCTALGGIAGSGLTDLDFPDGFVMVVKAYSSKVGGGPFITKFTEDEKEIAQLIYDTVGEKGVTTGRVRDLGWFDAPAIRHSINYNAPSVFMNCLDVIPKLKHVTNQIKVCTAYRNKATGEIIYSWPYHLDCFEPIYSYMEISPEMDDNVIMSSYIEFVEKCIGMKISGYGDGPSRENYHEREELM